MASLLATAPARAAIFVVDSTGDASDSNAGNGVCRAAGNVCTLRAAIQEANALAGADSIHFAIGTGLATIAPGAVLPNITGVVTIDGTTQPGYAGTPIVELSGASAGIANGLTLVLAGSSGSTIRGLVVNRFNGIAIRILSGSSNNVIAGNFLGTDPTGTLARPNSVGVYIQGTAGSPASNNRIGGTIAADRNLVSGNSVDGMQIDGVGAASNLVEGNYIGLDVTGTMAIGNGSQGVAIFNAAANNVIGGTAAGAGNVISGNGNIGITISVAGTTGNRVEGNYIGTDAAGTAGIGNARGIDVGNGAGGNSIGGTAAGAGNRIAFNAGKGLTLVAAAGTSNLISSNEIHSNGSLGIDLSDNGVTLNDPGDGDIGANDIQNYPVLSAAMSRSGSTTFAGSLNSAPNTMYRIEFFASTAADGTGFGEGERYLGFTTAMTDGSGNAVIAATLAASVAAGEFVTATATDPSNNSSEFSAAITAVQNLVVTTTSQTVDGNTTSVTALIASPGADARVSLREAITATNSTGPADIIHFGIPLSDPNHLYYRDDSIPGSLSLEAVTALPEPNVTDFDPDYPPGLTRSWYRIVPGSGLPFINDAVVVDATTQPGYIAGGPVVELVGTSAGVNGRGFAIPSGPASAIRGFIINGFGREGISSSASSVTVQGNYIGTDASGTLARGNGTSGTGAGVYIGGDGSQVGGLTLAERNILSGNVTNHLWIDADGVVVLGNYIGTDVTGTASLGGSDSGVVLQPVVSPTVTNVTIGGFAAGSRNLISGNFLHGIRLVGAGTQNNTLLGNAIGTDVSGTGALANGSDGVNLSNGASNNRIGGTAAGAGNRIAFNTGGGVVLDPTAGAGNAVLGNQIHANGSLGIDLGADGVTANDAGDVDGGANALLNFPFTTAAIESGGNLTVYFKLDVPAASYRVEFFKNPSGGDPSGNGEGQLLAASTNVTHPGGASMDFSHSFAGLVGDVITATATLCTDGGTCAAFGETSELGEAVTAATTAVELTSFTALPADGAVDLLWTTGSELNNLGFHLYRSPSAAGPFERVTETAIPGLGSSPAGASYRHRDGGLSNGVTYHYKLEDIETTGRSSFHGPVSATAGGDESSTVHGDPSRTSLRVVQRDANGVSIELVTGGFIAVRSPDGTVRLEAPGFEEGGPEGSPAIPVKRTWLDAIAGQPVRIASIREEEVTVFADLQPAGTAGVEIIASAGGTVRAERRRGRRTDPVTGLFPSSAARVLETGFQRERKKALLELAPLRWDPGSGRLSWARRLKVRLSFFGNVPSERTLGGAFGRRHRGPRTHSGRKVLAQLSTLRPGLYRVGFEEIFGARSRPLSSDSLRLSRRGETVALHLEPAGQSFGAGSSLYFLSPGDAVYELEWSSGGRTMTMPEIEAAPSGPIVSSYRDRRVWEQDRYYQAGLLDAPSLWLWEVVLSGASKTAPFHLHSVVEAEAELEVYLQGASDAEGPDHRVRVLVNRTAVGEASWDGKAAKTIRLRLPPRVLTEGANQITLENLGNAGAPYSMVFLDRFAVSTLRRPVAEDGRLEGDFLSSGTVSVERVSERSIVVQTSPEIGWIRGANEGPGGVSFQVEAGRSYLVVSPESVLSAEVRRPSGAGLRSTSNRADYLLIGPRELLSAAEPLLRRRQKQNLVSRAVAIEDLFSEFGHGEARPEALREFLEYAYHHWQGPPVRYVVLLGDATYDRKDHLGTGVLDRVPAFIKKTSYLWTASDPSYAAVNGEDPLPDLALGRLPAASLEEARRLVAKVLAWEESGQDLSGPAVLVADDPDAAGDFEADSEEIAERLRGREIERIYLRELGTPEARRRIRDSLDRGASLLSYVGHGGIALWASENLFGNADVADLASQSRQPIAMTLNCLNGYFHFPYFDALGEALVKAEGKGAIAAFSPSGLSLNAPAHFYHQALVEELTSGAHDRLGDAVLAAQARYAESGLFPELLAIYHLFGDPALAIR